MTDQTLPTVAAYPLPAPELRAPLRSAQADEGRHDPSTDISELCEALTPLISAAIARKARQRRYTP